MNAHVSHDLPRLLTGDATRDEALAAARHLRTCPDCQQELVAAVVAHAALVSAQRFAPQMVGHDQGQEQQVTARGEPSVAPLPDMSAVFAKVRAEAGTQQRRHKRLSRRQWLVGAAAAAVVVGGGVTAAELVVGGSSHAPAQMVALHAVGDVHGSATATISDGTMRIDATALPKLGPSRQYEVWLVARSGQQLRPLGYVGQNRTASLPVARQVMSRYNAIAISVQTTDQATFSGDVVVSGDYS